MDEVDDIIGAHRFIRNRLLGIGGVMSADQSTLVDIIGDRVYYLAAPTEEEQRACRRPDLRQEDNEDGFWPLIITSDRAATDRVVVGGASAYVEIVMDVKLVGKGPIGSLSILKKKIFRILQCSKGPVEDLYVMGCYRESSRIAKEVIHKVTYPTLIQSFRLRIQQAPI